MPLPGVVVAVFLLVFLLIASALISGSEVAFFSMNLHDFERLRQEKSKNAARILQLKERPRTLLATILIANNFVNIAIVIISEFIIRKTLPATLMEHWATAMNSALGIETYISLAATVRFINFSITVVGVAFLLVLFGEVLPKVYARMNNIKLAKLMSGPLVFLSVVFNPLSQFLVRGTGLIERRLDKNSSAMSVVSKEDFDNAIELTVSHEKDAKQEVDLLKSIVKFGDVCVKQIMRSRVDVIALDLRTSYKEVIETVRASGYSRVPIYDEDFDNIAGVLYVKDLIAYLDENNDFEWQQLIRTAVLFVPESKRISDLLKEFQSARLHLAVVVDEYGGTSGIVTLEDIMEEVVGDIRDEFDNEPEVQFKKLDEYNYLFEGKTLLNDVCRIIGVPIDTFDEMKGEADSIAGLLLELVGFLPKADREFVVKAFKFKVIAVNERRIEQVLLTLPK